MSTFFVEVCTVRPNGVAFIKPVPAPSWGAALTTAQQMAVKMFPEDPMTSRLFRNGYLTYSNRNDMGDPVIIRVVARAEALGEGSIRTGECVNR